MPPPFDASETFPASAKDEYVVLSGYTNEELVGMSQAADYLGQTMPQLQTLSVGIVAFLLAMADDDIPDWSSNISPDTTGSNVLQSHYFSLEGTQGALASVAEATGMNGAQVQKFASSIVVFLILLAIARSS